MTRLLKSLLRIVLSLALTGLFLYWAFRGVGAEQLWQAIAGTSLPWVAAMVATTLLTLVLRAWRWTVLLEPCAPQVRIWDAVLALAICYTANMGVPRSGEAIRALSLRWSRGAPIGSVLATVVVERILDMVWLVFFIGLALLLMHERVSQLYPWMGLVALLALGVCGVLLVALSLIYLYRERALVLVGRLLHRLSEKLAARIIRLLETFVQGLAALHRPSAYIEILLSSALLNAGYCAIIYEAFRSQAFHQSHGLGAGAAIVVMAISSIGVVVPAPAGTGPYHYFFGRSLHLLFAIPQAASLACATVVHAMANLTYLALGGPALLAQWLTARRSASVYPNDEAPGESPEA
ncbi:lysylphosphatidylglycerol synthase transmembrane domain-containing protein [Candidatus Latescibacterota bacterium]